MMTTIRRTDLRQLVDAGGDDLVSIYLPMHVGVESNQNPVRIKNLLSAAEDSLCRQGLRRPEAQKRLAAAWDTLSQPPTWKANSAHGLAVFIADHATRVWHLPFHCEESCVVGRQFHVLPLLAWLAENASYYALAVSQNAVRLFHGTRYQLDQVDIADLPTSLRAALHYDQREGMYQTHSAGPQLPGKEGLVFHGQGGEVDAAKVELTAFFREIDRALAGELRLQTDPLVFAGVDYLFPIFQEVSGYPHLLPTHISGNPELWNAVDVRELAWPIVEATIRARRDVELAKYGRRVAQGRTSNRLDEILIAAHAGAVETLFVDPAVRRTGTFDPELLTVLVDKEPQHQSDDLTNLAATLVLRNSGAVEPLASGNVPGGGVMAAVLRYPFSPATETASTAASG